MGEQRGLKVVAYDEQGISGERIEDRPAMQRLLADIQTGKVAAIICVATNRLSRDEDIIDTLVIQKTCRENDCLVITPEQTYNYAERTDTMFGQIRAIFDADQKQALVKATTRGQYAKARAGGWAGGFAPFGFRLVPGPPDGQGRIRNRLEIDPDEAPVVRLIFQWYAEGRAGEDGRWEPMSHRAIARALNKEERHLRVRLTRHGEARYERGERRPFAPQDVQRILRQRSYVGIFVRGERQLSKWVRDEGPVELHQSHLQIVDVSLWQRAQAVGRERAGASARRSVCATHALIGLLRCIHCGGTMSTALHSTRTADGAAVTYVNYSCLTRRRYGSNTCPGQMVSERPVRVAIEQLLVAQLRGLHLRRFLTQAAEEQSQLSEGELAQAVLVELQAAEQALGRLVDAVADGTLSHAEVRTKKLALMEKKERLQARLEKLRARAQVRDELLEAVERVETNLPERVRQLDDARFRHLARLVFDRIVATTEGSGLGCRATIVSHQLTAQFLELCSTSASPTLVSRSW